LFASVTNVQIYLIMIPENWQEMPVSQMIVGG